MPTRSPAAGGGGAGPPVAVGGHEGVIREKKLREKAFAPRMDREEVYCAEANPGPALEEFIAISIAALHQIAPEIGL